jgi:hypothetical protein
MIAFGKNEKHKLMHHNYCLFIGESRSVRRNEVQ